MDEVVRQVPQAWLGLQNTVVVACVLLCALLLVNYFASSRNKAQTNGRDQLRRPRTTMPPVFPNGWIPVLLSSELAPGQVKPLDVMGESLVAFRTADGKAHVTDAHCPHLGAHLGVGGRVTGTCIQCPFHGWKFDATDGTCREVPYSTTVPGFARLKTWRTSELLDIIFLWYDADGEDPSWDIQDVPEVTRDGWRLRGHGVHMARCHVQDIIENSADAAHFNCVHSSGLVFPSEDFTASDTWYGKVMRHEWRVSWTSKGAESLLAGSGGTCIFGWRPDFLQISIVMHLNGPAFAVARVKNRFLRAVMLQMVTPEAPLRVRMTYRLYADPQTSRLASWIVTYGIRKMLGRDLSVWQNKVYIKNPALVKEDRAISSYRKWYSQFYSKSSPTVDDVRDGTLEW